MAYGIKYTLPFKDVDGVSYVINILEEGYTGQPVELKGATPVCTIRTSGDDFLFTPHRHTSASINVLASGYLTDLFSTSVLQHKVLIYRAGALYWSGYIKPEVYTQDYQHDTYSWQIEAQSELAALWSMPFEYEGDGPAMVSLYTLIKRAFLACGGDYEFMYNPNTFRTDAGTNTMGINLMTVSEAVFDGLTWGEVLDAILTFIGWTLTDKNGAIWLVDPDCTNDSLSIMRRTLPDFGNATSVAADAKSIQSIGHRATNDTLDILAGYNYASVSIDLMPIDDSIPNLDYAQLQLKANSDEIGPAKQIGHNGDYHRTFKRFYLPGQLDFFIYDTSGNRITDEAVINAKDNGTILGAMPMMAQDLISDNEGSYFDPIRYNDKTFSLTECIQVRTRYGNTALENGKKMLSIKAPNCHYESGEMVSTGSQIVPYEYDAGAIVISGDVIINWTDQMPLNEEAEFSRYEGEYKDEQRYLKASLRIGNWYYGEDLSAGIVTVPMWRENPPESQKYFRLPISGGKIGAMASIYNNKDLLWHYNEGSGFFCRLVMPDKITPFNVSGDLEFSLYNEAFESSLATIGKHNYGYIIKGLGVRFVKCAHLYGFEPTERVYENVVNESYINAMGDVRFKLCSWREEDGPCHNQVLYDGSYLTDQLKNRHTGTGLRPEELYLTRVVNHYRHPLLKLTMGVKLSHAVNPSTAITDAHATGKRFLITASERDLQFGRERLALVQLNY